MPDSQYPPSANCVACPVHTHCFAENWEKGSRTVPFAPATVPLPQAGKMLYGIGNPASAIYVVRAGCIKTVTMDAEGNEHARAFHFPGDYVGLDALEVSTYPSTAVVVVPSQVCRISKGQLWQLFKSSPDALHRLLERTSHDLRNALALGGNYTADQRVASFLVAMEERLASAPGEDFELPMTRRDVANHLRLATETVCRVLARFSERGWLRGGTVLKIRQHAPLLELAKPVGADTSPARLAA